MPPPAWWSEKALFVLDGIEASAREELRALRLKKRHGTGDARREQFFTVALSQSQHARAALEECPEAARAVYHALQLASLALMPDAGEGRKLTKVREKGAAATNEIRRRRNWRAQCQAIARTLKPQPSARARALAVLQRLRPQSPTDRLPHERTIREYLK